MALISDYLTEKGGVPFSDRPFNEVDNYIISKIGSVNFSRLLTEDSTSAPLGEAVPRYFELFGGEGGYLGVLASPVILEVLRRLPELPRYRDLELTGYVRRILPAETEQFGALTVTLPGVWSYVSFRGTDDTLLGWKENFLMSVGPVEAQTDAAAYLNAMGKRLTEPLIVGGHSKGGNLAVYAAASADPALQARITAVYNNDGPGFLPEFYEEEGYKRIRSRIHTLLPQNTLVGTLLTREKWASIVKSSAIGPAAHDGFTWEVRDASFVRCPTLSPGSRAFEVTMDRVLATMDQEQRREFIEELFDALAATGAHTVTEMTEQKLNKALEVAGSFRKGTGTRRFVLEVLRELVKAYTRQRLGLE